MIRILYPFFAYLCIAVALCEDAPALQRFAFTEPVMGTTFRVVLYAPNEAAARIGARAAFDRIEQLDAMMTDYDENSELMKLCAKAGGPAVKVSDELFDILDKARDFNLKTQGAFDVTVGPVVRLWRKARADGKPPDPANIAKAMELVGADKLVLDPKEHTVQLLKSGMKLDLGGIAKGYAVDKALEVLKAKGFIQALVAGGGDIGLADPPPGKSGWTIDILPLDKAKRDNPVRLVLKQAGISTSGDEEQYLEAAGGKRYSHIVDPRTGKALEGRSSVTVYAPNCTSSDALAKVGVQGVEAALKTIDALPGTAVLFVVEEKDGIKEYASKAWKDVPKK
jgi:thiamine biosynthesis lipoprotein